MKRLRKMFKIVKSGKWYWKPQYCPHVQSMGTFRYDSLADDRAEIYEVQHGFMVHFIQVFWLRWIFCLDLTHDTKRFGGPIKYKIVKDVPPNAKQELSDLDIDTFLKSI